MNCRYCTTPEGHEELDGEPCPNCTHGEPPHTGDYGAPRSAGGYENAPATKLLATSCAVCRRPLVDAKSVELGIGPDCRKRYAFDFEVSEEARVRANRLVWEVAVDRAPAKVLANCTELRMLGFEVLSNTLLGRAATVRVTEEGGRLVVDAPYSEEALPALRAIAGRRWDGARKVNTFPLFRKAEVWSLLRAHYAGTLGLGPKGAFEIPEVK